jgi:predicted NAD/FAD-dependent oxidoreductase
MVVGLQSTLTFAREYLEATDLTAAADRMVQQLASHLAPWLTQSDWVQIHRWRYAFPENPLSHPTLMGLTKPPLLFAGDWCGGKRAEQGFLSGLVAADQLSQLLNKNAIAAASIWDAIAF